MDSEAPFDRMQKLSRAVAEFRNANAKLNGKLVPLEHENLQLKAQNLQLQKENTDLKQLLLAYENPHTPSSKSKKKRYPREKSGRGLGAPMGHEKYERKQPEPTETIEHTQELCSGCNKPLGEPFKIEAKTEEEIPEPQPPKIIRHLIYHYKCKCCGKIIVAPNNAPKGMFGFNLQTHVTLMKFDDRLPFRKVAVSLERHYKINITDTGILNIAKRVSTKLQKEYWEAIRRIRLARVVYADETEMKISGKKYWLWVFASENEVIFVIRKSRSKSVAEEILGNQFTGVVTSDGHSAYTKFSLHQRCWAHAIREAKELLEKYPSFGVFYENMKEMFAKIKEIRAKPPPDEERVFLKKELEQRMEQMINCMDGHIHFQKFATKLRNGIGCWFTCIEHLYVEPTNNIAERALRELIVQRKIMGGLRREKGARIMETITSMLATWKLQGKNLFQTLKGAISC